AAELQVLLEQDRHPRRLAAERADRALEIRHVREALAARALDQPLLADRMACANEAREPGEIRALEEITKDPALRPRWHISADAHRTEQPVIPRIADDELADRFPEKHQRRVGALIFGPYERASELERRG